MLLVLLVLLLLVERRISRKHRESLQLSNSWRRSCVERESPKRRRAGKVEGAERKDDRRYGRGREGDPEGGEGAGESRGSSLHREIHTEGRCGEGVGARRVAEWGPSRAQAGPGRATKGRFLPLTSLLKVPSGFLAARWCASSPTSTSWDRLRSHPRQATALFRSYFDRTWRLSIRHLCPCLPAPPQAHPRPSHIVRPIIRRPRSKLPSFFHFFPAFSLVIARYPIIAGEGGGSFEGAAQGLLNDFSSLRFVPSSADTRDSILVDRSWLASLRNGYDFYGFYSTEMLPVRFDLPVSLRFIGTI